MSKPKTLWGIPIVETDVLPEGEVVFGPLPTAEDIQQHGSLENAVGAMARQYCKIKGIRPRDNVLESDTIQ